MPDQQCPCGTGSPLSRCCQPLLAGTKRAVTALEHMRSRYTAFTLNDAAYLAASWHPSTRPADVTVPAGIEWRRLRIRDTQLGGPDDVTGAVEFVAHFRTQDGTRDFLHERSRFERQDGRWVYVDGELF